MADLDSLKRALAAVAACAAEYGTENNPVSWMKSELESLIAKKWALRQAFAGELSSAYESYVLTEYGAKLSAQSKEVIQQAISVLRELLGDDSADDAALEAVKESIAESVAAMASAIEAVEAKPAQTQTTEGKAPPAASGDAPMPHVIIPEGYTALPQHIVPIREVEGGAPGAGPVFDMLVIREGVSKNRIWYKREVLEPSSALLESRPLYVDHQMPDARGQMAPRSLASKGGWWSNVRYETDIPVREGKASGLMAHLNLYSPENSPVPWLPGMIRESLTRNAPEQVGISIVAAAGLKMGRDTQGVLKEATEIKLYASADAVAEPGAGGQPITLVAQEGVDHDVSALETMTLEELKTTRPDLFEAMKAQNPTPGDQQPAGTPPPAAQPPANTVQITTESWNELTTNLQAANEFIAIQQSSTIVEAKLAGVPHFNDAIKKQVRSRFAGKRVTAEEVDAVLTEYDAIAKAAFDPDHNYLPPGAILPWGRLSESITPLDQVVAAIDDMYGNPSEEMKGKFQPINSIREFFAQVTGDWEMNGAYDPQRSVIGQYLFEALPGASTLIGAGTVTMANLLGSGINRAVQRLYDGQPMWWRPLVEITRITNFKTQERIILHNFGSLTQRTIRGVGAGAEFTELTWGETKETYAPSVYGNIITITRETIIDDDLRGVAVIPRLLAQSAAITLNEYMAALWTANSGTGPTLSDSENVFAVAHANLRTEAFSRQAVLNSRKDIRKQTNHAGKRLSLLPRYLLVPIDLEDQAWPLTHSEREPENANNAANLLASADGGLRQTIVVPNWTNAGRYYLHCDPAQIQGIELGFLNGNQTPQLLSQTDPRTGLVYTNDVISHRVRHEFGAGWIDYRAGAAQVPA